MTDAATLSQNRASEPLSSTWLSANAGSGKTKVLTDRVARLLLQGVAPQHILCLTYTKAAASEMQNRLFALLGKWAMLPDAELRIALAKIGEDGGGADQLSNARRLFARAIEAPGGLKIQTIHSFCASLLRRFPLEAGLSPAFTEMDERAAKTLRAEVLEALAESSDHVAQLAQVFTGRDVETLLAEICSKAVLFDAPAPEATAFDLPADMDEARLLSNLFLGDEGSLLTQAIDYLAAGTKRNQDAAEKLRSLDLAGDRLAALRVLEDAMLYATGEKAGLARIGYIPTKPTRAAMGPLADQFEDLMKRVEAARPLRLGLAALRRTQALHAFAQPYLAEYRAQKEARAWLDFDDLIARTGQLLTDPSVAQWVLFKLDGGVDHILVDEAQDTSPAQWRVIELLTQEFTAGLGARDVERSLFVVGDKKQSIYSFQGADLQVFDKVQADFAKRLSNVGLHLNQAALEHSFRSSDAILRAVDMTFQSDGGAGLGGPPTHIAFFDTLPGRVDLWPAIEPEKANDTGEWYEPVDTISDEHHTRRLAKLIAAELRHMIDARTLVPHTKNGARVMTEGDVLILVRKRSVLFHEIITACKAAGLAIAGADRLRLGGEMAVRDLRALLAFLATPEDDLSLAACLRSPLFGWSEDALYRLAQGRGKGEYLWTRLRNRQDCPTLDILRDLRSQTDFLRPYDLVERMLTRHDGRRRLIARLGPEAEDGIDAFLAQTLAYEQAEIPSLTGFLTWLERDEVELKRELDSASPMLRVMTVHGAKGLEAPIVILPETADPKSPDRTELVALDDRIGWKAKSGENPAPMQAALDARAQRAAEEDARLLYVAMTRAESWLIVAGAGEMKNPDNWHNRVREGLNLAGAARFDAPTGQGLRLAHGDWPESAQDRAAPDAVRVDLSEALWHPAPSPPERAVPLRPSGLGGAKALPGEVGLAEEMALRLGTGLHLLLEHLPHWPRDSWDTRAARLLDYPEDAALLLPEAAAVLDSPALAHLFAPGSLAEVDIAGQIGDRPMSGVIDRLEVTPDHVLAVDYKTNRVVPNAAQDVPEGLLRQMGAYLVALEQVFPDRRVELALLWTANASLMRLPNDMLRAALARAGA